jgi:hypothetical protein
MPFGSSLASRPLPTGPLVMRPSAALSGRNDERQIEHLEFARAERAEFGERGREHLHRAKLQRLELFLVLVELRVRIDLDLHLAAGVFLGQFLEFLGALPFGVFGATTWLNLMMIGDCAAAGPTSASTATEAAARMIFFMFPPMTIESRGHRHGSEPLTTGSSQREPVKAIAR